MQIGDGSPGDDLNHTLNGQHIPYVPFNSASKNLRAGYLLFQFHYKGHDIIVVFTGNDHLILEYLRISACQGWTNVPLTLVA